jgi:hypothetical protein
VVFAAAASALARSVLGCEARYTPREGGPGLALRVVVSRPEDLALGLGGAVAPAVEAMVPAALGFRPARGDTLEVGADRYRVESVQQDATGASWRLTLARAP